MASEWAQKVEERGGALVGYARVSSQGQDLSVQTAALTAAGVTARHLFEEKASGTRREGRDQLAAMLRSFRKGDCLVVTRLDRLARSTRDLLEIADTLKEIGVDLVVLEQAINTATPEGRLFFTMLGAFGEFETEIRKARQREGIDAALAKGEDSPFRGRPATIKPADIAKLASDGVRPADIARRLGISRQSVYRIAKEARIELRQAG